jgi:Hydantoinase B/oxoprolinase
VPEGTLLNPRFPAPVSARMFACFKVFDAIMAAMSGPMPDRVIAASYSSIAAVALTYHSSSGYHIFREAIGGGYGAGSHYPGADAVAITLTNTANVPVKLTEQNFGAFVVESYRSGRVAAARAVIVAATASRSLTACSRAGCGSPAIPIITRSRPRAWPAGVLGGPRSSRWAGTEQSWRFRRWSWRPCTTVTC